MRTLKSFLSHPLIANIEGTLVPTGASTNNHHSTGRAHKGRCRKCIFTRMLNNNTGVFLISYQTPDFMLKTPGFTQPLAVSSRILDIFEYAPMFIVLTIDRAFGTNPSTVIRFFVAAYYGYGNGSSGVDQQRDPVRDLGRGDGCLGLRRQGLGFPRPAQSLTAIRRRHIIRPSGGRCICAGCR